MVPNAGYPGYIERVEGVSKNEHLPLTFCDIHIKRISNLKSRSGVAGNCTELHARTAWGSRLENMCQLV